jgi:hypothetical protein
MVLKKIPKRANGGVRGRGVGIGTGIGKEASTGVPAILESSSITGVRQWEHDGLGLTRPAAKAKEMDGILLATQSAYW